MTTIESKNRGGFARKIMVAVAGLLLQTAAATHGNAADPPRSFTSPRLQALDAIETLDKIVQLTGNRAPGTGASFDRDKVADDIVAMIFGDLQEPSGRVHIETALATIGALAGFSVQMGIREQLVSRGLLAENKAFVIVKTTAGETLYFGDLLNEGLFEARPGNQSVYALVAGGAQSAGAKTLPDVANIAGYVAGTVGKPTFGVPRVPPSNMPHSPSRALLNRYWNPVRNYLAVSTTAPTQWPFVLGLAAQKMIIRGKDVTDPALAASLVMETAIPMAKVAPATIHWADFKAH